jgi:hypothetical protein
LRLLDLRSLAPAVFWSRKVGLLDLRSLRTAYVRSSDIRLVHLRLGLGDLTAATIGIDTGIVGIHATADDLVVAALIAGSYLSGARACIAARAPHVVVIHATMDAVVAIQCAVVDAAAQDVAVDRDVAIGIVDVNIVEVYVRA